MSSEFVGYEGFNILSDIIKKYADSTDNVMNALETGVIQFVNDLLKLPKPMSKIKKAGYTHLVRSFAYRKNKSKNEIEAGWGKYYGPMVENGTEKMDAIPHVYPLWDKNKEKYYKTMLTSLGLKTW